MFEEEENENISSLNYVQNDVRFVGRREEIEEIKTGFKKRICRLRQIYGFPMVGKERLAEQVSLELKEESVDKNVNLQAINVSCNDVQNWQGFTLKLLKTCNQGLRIPQEQEYETEEQFLSVISRTCKDSNMYFLLTFTKCDELTSDNNAEMMFIRFCDKLLKSSNHVFIIVTNQKKLHYISSNDIRYTYLNILCLSEAESLLFEAARDVDMEGCADKILQRCFYLPGLILEAVRLLKHTDGLIDPASLCELLDSPEKALKTFSMKHVNPSFNVSNMLEKFCNRLIKHQIWKDLQNLALFHGSFSREAASAVLGFKNKNEATVSALIPLRDHAAIDIIRESQRIQVNPILRTFLLQESPLQEDIHEQNSAKLRYIKFFGEVVLKLDSCFQEYPNSVVPGYLHDDYDNVKEMMLAAIHCTEDIFKALMMAVKSTEEIFVECFPLDKVKDFYENLLNAAALYGNCEDIAILKYRLGQVLATKKVDANIQAVLKLYKEALQTLNNSGSKYHTLILLGLIAQTLIRQGKYQKGLMYVHKALGTEVESCENRKIERRKIHIYSQKAIAELFLERRESATQILNDALEQAQTVAPYHPDVPVMLNSLGLICEKDEDHEQALHYYNVSLQKRRSYASSKPEILVPTLNNIGTQLIIRGNYGLALERLNEALEIRKQCGWNDYFTAITLWNIGKVHLLVMDVEEAMKTFEEAKRIFHICTPKHFIINEVNISIAHCFQITGRSNSSLELYRSILQHKEVYMKNVPRGEQTALVYHHVLNLSESEHWIEIYNKLQEEMHRLGKCAKDDGDERKYLSLQKRISEYRNLFTCWIDNSTQVRVLALDMIKRYCMFCRHIHAGASEHSDS